MSRDCTGSGIKFHSPYNDEQSLLAEESHIGLFSKMKKTTKNARSGVSKTKKRSQLQVQASIPGMGSGSVNWGSSQVAPLAKTRIVRTPKQPLVSRTKDTTVISHREFITDVSGHSGFTATKYAINPGNPDVFQWLSDVANQYETYHFTKLVFCFETSKSCDTDGSVMMAVDFDAKDPPPTDKQELMSYAGAIRGAPWSEFSYVCTPSDLQKFVKERYVREANTGVNDDIKTYDVGNLFFATSGFEETTPIGELYVDYTVVFKTPQGSKPNVPNTLFWYDTYSASAVESTTWFAGTAVAASGEMGAIATYDTLVLPYRGFYEVYSSALGAASPTASVWTTSTGNVIQEMSTGGLQRAQRWSFYAGQDACTFTQTATLNVQEEDRTLQVFWLGIGVGESSSGPSSLRGVLGRIVKSGRRKISEVKERIVKEASQNASGSSARTNSEGKRPGDFQSLQGVLHAQYMRGGVARSPPLY